MIDIIFSCSNQFISYIFVCLKSLQNVISDENSYNVVILEKGISDKNKKILQTLNKENFHINFINMKEITNGISFFAHDHVTDETFFKLFIPLIFKDKDKVLFCDADIIFLDDPAKLFQYDLGNKKIGASLCHLWNGIMNYDENSFKYTTEKLKIKNPEKYFQGGVLLYQCKLFTKSDIEKCINMAGERYNCLDQDILNSCFQDDVYLFDSRWNYETAQRGFELTIPYMDKKHKKMWQDAQKHPAIVHYSGLYKPWFYPDEEFAQLWWSFARKTPFYEEILKRMSENDFAPLRKHFQETIIDITHYRRNILKYWKYKFLKNFVCGKTKERYMNKKYQYKNKIRNAKQYI